MEISIRATCFLGTSTRIYKASPHRREFNLYREAVNVQLNFMWGGLAVIDHYVTSVLLIDDYSFFGAV